ncbi:UNVERIFIED_CONTAM: hypothetical protein FKN15_002487 [Acipenser sinensis]
MMKLRMRHGVITLLDCFVQQAKKIPNKPFIIHEGDVYTYEDMDKRSNKVAQVFLQQGSLKKGDIAALLMSNEPDFINVWFGLSKLGCEVAFLNFNIKSKSLLHCFNSCGATTLVVGADLISSLEDVLLTLQNNGINIWLMEKSSTFQGVNTILDKLEHASDDPVPLDVSSQTNIMSTFLYIFTSGTTGLPKAARISHLKAVMCLCFFQMCGATSDDIIYVTLPLYHMSASLLGIGGCIELGHEGKAGMVAVVLKPEHKLDGRRLYSHLAEHLPAYSWPRFLRVQASLDVTETFKQQKGRLVEEGFSPSAVSEALYFLDESEKTYVPLTKNLFDDIVSGQIRL